MLTLQDIMLMSLIAGLATCLGSLIVVMFGKPHEKTLAVFLGMATGIMLAVISVDLIPSALAFGSPWSTLAGFLLGILIMYALDLLLSWFYPQNKNNASRKGYLLKMGYLIAIGIALHDLPEGMAIAVGYSATTKLGLVLILGIGMHNIPEGMATAAPLRMGGMAPWRIILISTLVSIFTPLGTWIGFGLVSLKPTWITLMLALAGGAMAYLVKDELLPESMRYHPNYARLGILLGASVIVALTFIHH